jgi:hypothetical protein
MRIFDLDDRRARDEVVEAVAWTREVAGPGGADVVVLSADFIDQLWLTEGLHTLPLVDYPFLHPPYLPPSWDEATPDRWALVGPGGWVDAPDSAVVARNADFRLVDLTAGPVTIALPTNGFLPAEPGADPSSVAMGDDGQIVVVRNDTTRTVTALAAANPALGPVHVDVLTADGEPVGGFEVASATGPVSVPVPAGRIVTVTLRNDPRAASPGGGDPRVLSLVLSDVAGASPLQRPGG